MSGSWESFGQQALILALNAIFKDGKTIDFNVSNQGSITANVTSEQTTDYVLYDDLPLFGIYEIDTFTPQVGESILVINKGVLNGIYEIKTSEWTRSSLFNNDDNIKNNCKITVEKTGEIFITQLETAFTEGISELIFNKIKTRMNQIFHFESEDWIDDINSQVSITFEHWFRTNRILTHIFEGDQEVEVESVISDGSLKMLMPNEPISLRFNGYIVLEELL